MWGKARQSLVCFVLCWCTQAVSNPAWASAALHFTTAQTLSIAATGFSAPPYEIDTTLILGDWETVELPYVMQRPAPSAASASDFAEPGTIVTWVRLLVPVLRVPTSPRYLYIPRWKADGTLAVYADGRRIFQSQSNIRWNGWNIPLWLPLGDSKNGVQPTEIILRMERPDDSGAALSSLWMGSQSDLEWRYRIRDALQVQLPYLGSTAFLLAGCFALLVGYRNRKDLSYLLFFLVSLTSYFRSLHFYVGESRLVMSDEWFTWLTINALFWMLCTVHFSLNILHGRALRWLDWTIGSLSVLMAFLTLPSLPEIPSAYQFSPLYYMVLLVAGTTVGTVGLHRSLAVNSSDGVLLSVWALIGMVLGGFDWLLQSNWLSPEAIYLGPYSNLAAFAVFVSILFGRYTAANVAVRDANASLEMRLQQRELALQRSHILLREIEHRQTLADERQRLMQDMHDGLGSSLRSALLAVERGHLTEASVAEILKDCIDDLKLTIDSLEPLDADLLLLLATLRFRLEPRLEAAGIRLLWRVEAVPPLEWLDPRNSLHILRILQEAITNTIKHTHASEIYVETAADTTRVTIAIADNGQGFDVTNPAIGRGLGNQRRRAQAIGAEIQWESNAHGTRLVLRLPIVRTL